MAIMNCPECGHQVSDRAPVCPNCGVEISGKTLPCPSCGKIILRDYDSCPHCGITRKQSKTPPALLYKNDKSDNGINSRRANVKKKRQDNKRRSFLSAYFFFIVLTLIVALVSLYFYRNNLKEKETLAYNNAMRSNNPQLLRSFLNNFSNASREHTDSVQMRLDMLNMIDEEWENVKMMRAKQPLQDYLSKYPDTKHKGEIENMLDSIDWRQALRSENVDVFSQYVSSHPYGKYADEAREKISELKAKIVLPEERDKIAQLMHRFFVSVNTRNEAKLAACLSRQMSTFLGEANPSENDVKQWIDRQYKENVEEITWRLNNDYQISKREVGENAYEYTVNFTASEDIRRTDAGQSSTEHYRITAKVTPDGLLSGMSINRIQT